MNFARRGCIMMHELLLRPSWDAARQSSTSSKLTGLANRRLSGSPDQDEEPGTARGLATSNAKKGNALRRSQTSARQRSPCATSEDLPRNSSGFLKPMTFKKLLATALERVPSLPKASTQAKDAATKPVPPCLIAGHLVRKNNQKRPVIDLRYHDRVKSTEVNAVYCLDENARWIPHPDFATSWSRGTTHSKESSQVKDIVLPLRLSLEEVYGGTFKFFTFRRKIWHKYDVEEVPYGTVLFDMEVPKGVPDGAKLRFTSCGHQYKTHSDDVVFIIKWNRHSAFDWDGGKLMHKITLTPSEAQHGFVRQLGNVDGTKWHISGDGPTNIAHKLVIPGHGLPLVSAPQSRGSLEISLHVAFPKVTSKLMLMQKFETDKLRQEGGPFFAKLKHVHNAEVHTSFLGKQQDGNLDSTVLYGYPWK